MPAPGLAPFCCHGVHTPGTAHTDVCTDGHLQPLTRGPSTGLKAEKTLKPLHAGGNGGQGAETGWSRVPLPHPRPVSSQLMGKDSGSEGSGDFPRPPVLPGSKAGALCLEPPTWADSRCQASSALDPSEAGPEELPAVQTESPPKPINPHLPEGLRPLRRDPRGPRLSHGAGEVVARVGPLAWGL